MESGDDAKHKADELAARGKQKAGETFDDEELREEGRKEEKKSQAKQVGEKIKKLFKN